MSLTIKDEYEPQEIVPAGLTHAVCYQVIEIGTQPQHDPKYPPRKKVVITHELPNRRGEFDGKNQPRAISGTYSLTMAPNGHLRSMLKTWRGRDFTDSELAGFNLTKLLGINSYLNVAHNPSKKAGSTRVYANIDTVNPLPDDLEKKDSENPEMFFELPPVGEKVMIPEWIPKWLAKKIEDSEEYGKGDGSFEDNLTRDNPAEPEVTIEDDDDVPF